MTVAVIVLALTVAALLYDRAATRVATERERGTLLQRIQAPERAVAVQARREDAERPRRRVRPVALDDDGAMNKAIEGDGDGGA